MNNKAFIFLFSFLVFLFSFGCNTHQNDPQKPLQNEPTKTEGFAKVSINDLPKEASVVLIKINSGTSFRNKKDGAVFKNYERILPKKPDGYYKEYTVITPGSRTRGTRRLITGSNGEIYYTDDHYKTFKEVMR